MSKKHLWRRDASLLQISLKCMNRLNRALDHMFNLTSSSNRPDVCDTLLPNGRKRRQTSVLRTWTHLQMYEMLCLTSVNIFVKRKLKKRNFISNTVSSGKISVLFWTFCFSIWFELVVCSTFDVLFFLNFNGEEEWKLPQVSFRLFDRSKPLETLRSDIDQTWLLETTLKMGFSMSFRSNWRHLILGISFVWVIRDRFYCLYMCLTVNSNSHRSLGNWKENWKLLMKHSLVSTCCGCEKPPHQSNKNNSSFSRHSPAIQWRRVPFQLWSTAGCPLAPRDPPLFI